MIKGHEKQEGNDTNDYIEHDPVGSRKGRHRWARLAYIRVKASRLAAAVLSSELNHGLEF
jgi:hypothetical protein